MKRLLVAAALAVLSSCAVNPGPVVTPETRATLAIEVTDAATGQAVSDALVVLHTGEQARTNADGYVAFDGLIADAATCGSCGRGVSVSAGSYHDGFESIDTFHGNVQRQVKLARLSPPVPPTLPVTPPWIGQLRKSRDDLGFEDATGRGILPICAHFGEAFSAFVRRPDAVENQLRIVKAAGYDCVRVWDVLGYYDSNRSDQSGQWSAWKGKEVTPVPFVAYSGRSIPATPDYYDQWRAFVLAVKRSGLTLFHSRGDLNGIKLAQVLDHTRRLASIYDDPAVGWDVLALAEANNENWQNGAFSPDELRRIVEPFKARGALTVHSTAERAEEPPDMQEIAAGASIYSVHGLRTSAWTNILEHIFGLGYFPRNPDWLGVPRLGVQGEPAGPGEGVSVGQVNDREMLAMMAATSLVSRQWWVYMSGHGVFWRGPLESQPGFSVVPRVRAALDAFAPDVMSWGLYHGGRAEAALVSPTGYFGDPGVADGPSRIFNAVRGDRRRVVAVIEGGKGEIRAQNKLSCTLSLTVVGVKEDETISIDTFTLAQGASLQIQYTAGRVLLGECQ